MKTFDSDRPALVPGNLARFTNEDTTITYIGRIVDVEDAAGWFARALMRPLWRILDDDRAVSAPGNLMDVASLRWTRWVDADELESTVDPARAEPGSRRPAPEPWQVDVTAGAGFEDVVFYREGDSGYEIVTGFLTTGGFRSAHFPLDQRDDVFAIHRVRLPAGTSRAFAARVPGGYAEKIALRGLMVNVASTIIDTPGCEMRNADGSPLGPSWAVARTLELVAEMLDVTGPRTLARSERPDIDGEIDGWRPINAENGYADELPADGQLVWLDNGISYVLGLYRTDLVGREIAPELPTRPWCDRFGNSLPHIPFGWRPLDGPPPRVTP